MSGSRTLAFIADNGKSFLKALVRRKKFTEEDLTETKLARCLGTLDLTALGIGSTLGAGVYVVAGEVAKTTAGPSVVLSFLIAAAASVLAGVCYAEFGARVPKTGSAYVYSYVSVGELMAFVIGWNLILEYIIGTASVARAWSANFDKIVGNRLSEFSRRTATMNISGLAEYPDFFSVAITLLLAVILSIGVRESATFNKIFTAVNLCVVLFVIVCGLFNLDFANWNLDPNSFNYSSSNPNSSEYWDAVSNSTFNASSIAVGQGGFFPFGVSGMISGAGTCFYAFVGFDSIATTGEEVKNPQKAIPISIVLCLFICFLAYFGLSAVVTLVCPYYLLDAAAPLPSIFQRVGWSVATYIIGIGAVCALSTSLLGCMFPLPRVIYAMAADGLLFRFLARVNSRLKTPLIATILSGCMAAGMACLFDLKDLVDMMSIGTLLAYTLVAVSVLILRGKQHAIGGISTSDDDETDALELQQQNGDDKRVSSDVSLPPVGGPPLTMTKYLRHFFFPPAPRPTHVSETVCKANTYLFFVSVFGLNLCGLAVEWGYTMFLVGVAVWALLALLFIISLARQPQNTRKISFKVPWVPFTPGLSILVNVHLMIKLPGSTWVRFVVWLAIGFLIYFCYGIFHSSERKSGSAKKQEVTKTVEPFEETKFWLTPVSPTTHQDQQNQHQRSKEIHNGTLLPPLPSDACPDSVTVQRPAAYCP